MNRWGRMVLAAGPITNAPLADLRGTAVDLTTEILIEADDHEVDFFDATHRVLRKALGKRGFERARRAMFSAATWAADDLRICRRLALELPLGSRSKRLVWTQMARPYRCAALGSESPVLPWSDDGCYRRFSTIYQDRARHPAHDLYRTAKCGH